ncbi:MAG: glycosyltransferase family 9 protein [Planctomycetota bacterium]
MSRVLLVRLSAMGDVVQSLGAVAALQAARPDWQLHFATQRENAPLLLELGLAGVVAHDRRGGVRAVWRTARALRALRCDLALDLQGNAKSALLARLSGAPERVGAAARWRQEPWSRIGLTRCVEVDGPRHPALVAHAVVAAVAPDAVWHLPRLVATAAEVAAVADRVRSLGVAPERPFRVVAVGRERDPRSQRRGGLAMELAPRDRPVLALLGPQEAGVTLPAGVPALRQLAGSVRELVALGALVSASGGDAVGPDQGPVHVLAAAGAPVTVLFGPQDPERTAPPAARVLRRADPPPCAPCRQRRCHHEQGPVCMSFCSADGAEVAKPSWLRGRST